MEQQLQFFQWTRQNILHLLQDLTEQQISRIPGGLNNNILWNAGHIHWVQQVLVYQLAGISPDFTESFQSKYSSGNFPTDGDSTDLSLIIDLLDKSTKKTVTDFKAGRFQGYQSISSRYDHVEFTFTEWEDAFQYNNLHEARHYGFMKALAKAV